jgi:hypothetical protein
VWTPSTQALDVVQQTCAVLRDAEADNRYLCPRLLNSKAR